MVVGVLVEFEVLRLQVDWIDDGGYNEKVCVGMIVHRL